uniref:Uncharacterized protein n=1 Tax=Candidatus Kentrum sp. DK TaxID=2126562 RepID=A0A450TQ26_9GAMM|nr:MAG: hypothetical protein BECKDK2373B_GA0170837_12673 [Candidatus Kentron sp. DK]
MTHIAYLRVSTDCYVPPYSRETDPTYFRRDKS